MLCACCRDVLEGLIAEYKACATPDYGSWDASAAAASASGAGSAVGGGFGGAGADDDEYGSGECLPFLQFLLLKNSETLTERISQKSGVIVA